MTIVARNDIDGAIVNVSRVRVNHAVLIAVTGVIVYVGAVVAGPTWFVFFNAPPVVVASARAGTWLAPLTALAIAA